MKKFEKGKLYRHKNCTDIDFFIASEPEDVGNDWLLKVKYWNRAYKMFQPDSTFIDDVVIKKDLIRNWSKVDE